MDEWLEGGSTELDDGLTPRELEVVKLIAEAYTNKQIAETLKLVGEDRRVAPRRTCSGSSACATAWRSSATRSAAAW